MTVTDPIADMLTRIRNAGKAKHSSVDMPSSKLKIRISDILKENGYIKNYKVIDDGKQGVLRVYLKYDKSQAHVIYGIERISKVGRRIYSKKKDVAPVLNGMGISIMSTSKGVMTDKQAIRENVGGEVLCNVW